MPSAEMAYSPIQPLTSPNGCDAKRRCRHPGYPRSSASRRPRSAKFSSELAEDGSIIADVLVGSEAAGGEPGLAVMDAQNLEILLRRARAIARPIVSARQPEDLARLVFEVQALRSTSPDGRADLERALEALEGVAAPAALWETELLPARVPRYRSADLDAALATSPWQWLGLGKGRVSLCRVEDLELFLPARKGSSLSGSKLLPEGGSSFDFWTIRERAGGSSAAVARELWGEAWKGLVASDSFRDVREGIANEFGSRLPEMPDDGETLVGSSGRVPFGAPRRVPRALRERWRSGAPAGGRWFRLDFSDDPETDEPDALDEAGLDAARVRILAGRYGLLCRSMLEREDEGLRWSDLFPAMRRLELAGELLAGRFFEGLEGPQFLEIAAFQAFTALGGAARSEGPIWVNALDPAATALYAPVERQSLLPPRIAANRLCVDAGKVVAASTRSFRDLALGVSAEDPRLPVVLDFFPSVRNREARPERRVVVEAVNGEPAALSAYAEAMREAGFEADRGRMVLW